ncbi:MAG: phosphatase PAP2 family protein [Pygmaiobacter sp.]
MEKKQRILLLFFALIAAVLLALAAVYDLALDTFLYRPASVFAILGEAFCYWPLYLPFALLGGVMAALPDTKLYRRALGVALCAACFSGLFASALTTLATRGLLGAVRVPAWLLLGAMLTLCTVFSLCKANRAALIKLAFLAKFGIVLCVLDNGIIHWLKHFFSRMRYDDMVRLGDFSAFSPWYQRGAFAGNTSFPSGHVASACGILVVLLLPLLFRRLQGKELPLTLLCYGYIALCALSRMVIGRHFLSDTVAAATIVSILFFAMLSSRCFQAKLRHTLQRAETER